ncbi:unnamed protein product [Rhizophagus irregularis]|nr:unnamed protein product [Rhizophagus irregularis]
MSTQINRGENENEFNITMSPVISNPKDLNDKNCKEFNIIIIGFIEFKGKVFQVPPSVEMSVTDLGTGTKLGHVNGDLELEQEIFLNVNVPNAGTFIEGYISVVHNISHFRCLTLSETVWVCIFVPRTKYRSYHQEIKTLKTIRLNASYVTISLKYFLSFKQPENNILIILAPTEQGNVVFAHQLSSRHKLIIC